MSFKNLTGMRAPENIDQRLKEFIEHEARSCSMDIGGITPEYVYRMWGGSVSVEEIAAGHVELQKQGFLRR